MSKFLFRTPASFCSVFNKTRSFSSITPLVNRSIQKKNHNLQKLINSVELVRQVPNIALTENRFLHYNSSNPFENEEPDSSDRYPKRSYRDQDRDFTNSGYENRSYREENRPYRDQNRSFRDQDRSFGDRDRSFRNQRDSRRDQNSYDEDNYGNRSFSNNFGNLEERDWGKVKLVRLNKNIYNPHEKVTQRSQEEIKAFRDENQIKIVNDDNKRSIPNPILEFEEGGFSQEILSKLQNLGFNRPMPIQAQAWPIVMSGLDLIGIGETGSGKTLGFMLPALMHIINHPERQTKKRYSNGPIALVIAPTRELAQQIESVARKFGQGSDRIRSTCLFGGASKGPQIRDLESGVDLAIATPGRLIDLIESNCTSLERCSYVVLDEADRMLDMGFEPQIRKILGQIRPDRQMLMWSATWPEDVRELAEDFLIPAHSGDTEQYVQLNIGSTELQAAQTIKQNIEIFSGTDSRDRIRRLLELLDKDSPDSRSDQKVLVFAETKKDVDFLERILRREGHNASSIHGGKTQNQRDTVLSRFRTGQTPILIATDVAARGIDVNDIRCVINYEFPRNIEDYVHRIGRTGRAGKSGVSYAFFSEDDYKKAKDLIKVLRKAQQEVPEALQEMANPVSKRRGQNDNSFNRGRRFDGDSRRYSRDFASQMRRAKIDLLYEE